LEPSARISSNDIRAILETVPVPAWSVTCDGSLEFFNQAWQQYTGLLVEQTETGNWTQVVHPDDVKRLLFDGQSAAEAQSESFVDRANERLYRSD
jgi:PAS domain S-box-containing protein